MSVLSLGPGTEMLVCVANVQPVHVTLLFPSEGVALGVQSMLGGLCSLAQNIPKEFSFSSVEVDLQPSGLGRLVKACDKGFNDLLNALVCRSMDKHCTVVNEGDVDKSFSWHGASFSVILDRSLTT